MIIIDRINRQGLIRGGLIALMIITMLLVLACIPESLHYQKSEEGIEFTTKPGECINCPIESEQKYIDKLYQNPSEEQQEQSTKQPIESTLLLAQDAKLINKLENTWHLKKSVMVENYKNQLEIISAKSCLLI